MIVLADDGTKKVRVGGKISTSKCKQSEHETGTQMKEAFEKQSEIVKVSATEEAGAGYNPMPVR